MPFQYRIINKFSRVLYELPVLDLIRNAIIYLIRKLRTQGSYVEYIYAFGTLLLKLLIKQFEIL